jgi:SSS family solute:Na+ symporter
VTLAVIIVYLLAVILTGVASHRLFRGTGEDFFVASRSIGPVLLLVALFGAHMTSFSLLGASAEAYQRGVGVFALMASSSAVIAPLLFLTVGTRVWALGKRHGFVSPVALFRARWGSNALGLVLFVVLLGLLLPYLLIGLLGAGMTLAQITAGLVPEWLGSLIVVAVVLTYTTYGGMRGTVWVNALQTSVFLLFGGVALGVIGHRLGGLEVAVARVGTSRPDLLVVSTNFPPAELWTYLLIPLSVGMFPHMLLHWLTADRARSFRLAVVGYPLFIAAVWLPSVLLGVLARGDFPNLAPREASTVLVRMIELHAPGWLAGLLAAGVLSAVLSSFDSQVLAVGTMFTHDIVRHYGFADRLTPRQELAIGRGFVVAVLVATFVLSRLITPSIFRLGVWCFSGFAALLPIMLAALFWRRSTAVGAMASALTVAGLWLWFVVGGGQLPGLLGATGALPVAFMLAASSLAMVVGSLGSSPPSAAHLAGFFGDAEPGGSAP